MPEGYTPSLTRSGTFTAGATDYLRVTGEPAEAGEPSPGYGYVTAVTKGDEVKFTCPSVWTNADETVGAVAKGWRLTLADGTVTTGTELAKTVTYGEDTAGATLTWLWEVFYKVTAAVSGGGSVDRSEQWIKAGASATVTATASAGSKFVFWNGGADSFQSVLTLPAVTAPVALTAHFRDASDKVVYVATTGEDGDGRGTAAAPYKTVNVAFDALSADLGTASGVVALAEGTYCLTNTLWLTNAVRVIGAGMYKSFVSGVNIQGTNSVWAGLRGVAVKHEAAGMRDLTVTGCSSKDLVGSGIYMSKGTLECVRSYANRSGLGEYLRPARGSGLYMDGGLATNCIIEANVGEGGYGDRIGTGLCMAGGTFTDGRIIDNVCNRAQISGAGVAIIGKDVVLRNTLVSGNTSKQTNPDSCSHGIGVYMTANGTVENCRILDNGVQSVYLSSGTLKNCLVTGGKNNSTDYTAGVQVSGAAKVYHCTIWGNSAANKFSGMLVENASAVVVNNIVYGNGTDGSVKASAGTFQTNVVDSLALVTTASAAGNVVNDPLFANPSEGDFSFDHGSPAFDTAATIAGIDRDLDGVARPKNDAPDIGCYECEVVFESMEVKISVSKTDWAPGEDPAAAARVFGAKGAVSFKWYVDGALVAGATTANPTFPGLSPGRHTVSVEATDGVTTANDIKTDAFTVKTCEVYVDDKTGDDTANFPYEETSRPAKTVNAAFDALGRSASNTCTVHVASGTYYLAKELTLDTPCRIYGADRETTVLDGSKLASTARGISITAKGSIVKSLTVCKCKTLMGGTGIYMSADGRVEDVIIRDNESGMGRTDASPGSGAGLNQSAGTVTNCVISGNSQNTTYGTSYGAGVNISGGTLVDSVISDNWRNRNQIRGAGLKVGGTAKVLRCRIVGNSNRQGTWDNQTYGMGVYMDGGTVEKCEIVDNGRQAVFASAGTLKNCLIAGSKTAPSEYPGGLRLEGSATVINCTVAGNISSQSTISDLSMIGGKFINSIAQYAEVTGGVFDHSLTNANPLYRKPEESDYRLRMGSPCIDAGDWSKLGDTKPSVRAQQDLIGTRRLFGSDVDMGCYEKRLSGFAIRVR